MTGNLLHREVTWAEIDVRAQTVIQAIKRAESHISRIIGIEKGGLVPAAMILQAFPDADFFTLKASRFMRNDKMEVKAEFDKLYHVTPLLNTQLTLVVDEICDSGKTFDLIRQVLPNALYAALFVREGSTSNPPNFWGHTEPDNTWLNFPWEVFSPQPGQA